MTAPAWIAFGAAWVGSLGGLVGLVWSGMVRRVAAVEASMGQCQTAEGACFRAIEARLNAHDIAIATLLESGRRMDRVDQHVDELTKQVVRMMAHVDGMAAR